MQSTGSTETIASAGVTQLSGVVPKRGATVKTFKGVDAHGFAV
jgi:hypothetical protein